MGQTVMSEGPGRCRGHGRPGTAGFGETYDGPSERRRRSSWLAFDLVDSLSHERLELSGIGGSNILVDDLTNYLPSLEYDHIGTDRDSLNLQRDGIGTRSVSDSWE
jgi:hypothetical protein